jgi:hypothetical protein
VAKAALFNSFLYLLVSLIKVGHKSSIRILSQFNIELWPLTSLVLTFSHNFGTSQKIETLTIESTQVAVKSFTTPNNTCKVVKSCTM